MDFVSTLATRGDVFDQATGGIRAADRFLERTEFVRLSNGDVLKRVYRYKLESIVTFVEPLSGDVAESAAHSDDQVSAVNPAKKEV